MVPYSHACRTTGSSRDPLHKGVLQGPLTRSSAPRLVAEDDPWAGDQEFLIEVIVSKYERRKSQTDTVNAMPLYPTEAVLWDENQVPKVHYTGERPS